MSKGQLLCLRLVRSHDKLNQRMMRVYMKREPSDSIAITWNFYISWQRSTVLILQAMYDLLV